MISILLVDDDIHIRQLLKDYLSEFGMSVTAVADGKLMAEALASGTFDLVILDLMLPGEDGLTLCKELRSKSDIPILMLTARGETMDRIIGLEVGADDYIVKPFEPRELVARIQTILRRVKGNRDSSAQKEQAPVWSTPTNTAPSFLWFLTSKTIRRLRMPNRFCPGSPICTGYVCPLRALMQPWSNCCAITANASLFTPATATRKSTKLLG